MNDDLKKFSDECLETYLSKSGVTATPVGFDPTIFITIITMILQACNKTPQDIHAEAQAGSMLARLTVHGQTRKALRERYGLFGYARFGGAAIEHAILTTTAGRSPELIGSVQEYCA